MQSSGECKVVQSSGFPRLFAPRAQLSLLLCLCGGGSSSAQSLNICGHPAWAVKLRGLSLLFCLLLMFLFYLLKDIFGFGMFSVDLYLIFMSAFFSVLLFHLKVRFREANKC